MTSNTVKKFHLDVIDQLFEQSRTLWDEEGLDESSMFDLRQLWEQKLSEAGIEVNKHALGASEEERPAQKNRSDRRPKNPPATNAVSSSVMSSPPSMAPSSSHLPIYQQIIHGTLPDTHSIQQQQQQQQMLPSHSQYIQQQQQQQQPPPLAQQYLQQQQQQQQQSQHHMMNLSNSSNVSGNQSFGNMSQNHNEDLSQSRLMQYGHMSNMQLSSQQANAIASSVLRQGAQTQHNHQQLQQPPPSISTQELQRMYVGNNAASMAERSSHIQAMDRLSQNGINRNDQQQMWTVRPSSLSNVRQTMGAQHLTAIHFNKQNNAARQMNGVNVGSGNQQFNLMQNNNINANYTSGGQVSLHQVGTGVPGYSSVIHVMDRSGNQQALPVISSGGMGVPLENMTGVVGSSQQPGQQNVRKHGPVAVQLDGMDDDSFEDLSDDDGDLRSIEHITKKTKTSERSSSARLEDPDLDSDDDDDEDDPINIDQVENVVVCQFEKISRTRNRWKFHLKSGMCSLNGREFVFQKAVGESEF